MRNRPRRADCGQTRSRRRLGVETLETRRVLAASLSFPGQNVELQPGEQFLKIVQAEDNSNVLDEINFDGIDDNRIEISAAAFQVDTDVNLSGYDLLVSAESILVVNGGLLGAGQVVLSAVKQPDLGDVISDAVLNGLVANESQTIEVRNSTISANQITLSANGITSTGWSELGGHQDVIADELITQLQTLPQIGLSGAVSPLSGQAKIHNASAGITLADSVLRSVGAIDVSATAVADSSLNSIAVTGLNGSGLPATVSVGFSHSTSSATIDVLGTTQMEATGSVNLVTDATSTAINVARNEANSRARSQDAEKVKTAVNLSLALTNETSTIDVAAGTTIHSGGEVNVKAVSEVINDVTATTAVFNDGTVGFSAAVGVDNAIVRSEVNGTIQSDGVSGSQIDFTGADIFSSSDYLLLNNIPAANPILAGERLTYRGETPMPGLIDGEEYIVREANIRSQHADGVQQTVRLARAESVDLENANVDAEAIHSLTRLSVIKFDASEVSSEDASNDGRIEMTLPDGVSSLVYLGSEAGDDDILPQSITGLKQNQRYEAVQIGSQIKLRLPGTIDFVDFSLPAGTSGTHGFRYDENRLSFNPLDDVNAEDDWISLPADHRFQTGDFLLYATDPSRSEEHEMFAFDASESVVSSLGSVSLPDAPINGLDNHHGYYAVVDPHYPNQLRLTGSLADAFGSETVDISFGGSTDHTLTRTSGGISVVAQLSAINKAEAGVNLTQGEQPWSSVLSGVGAGRIENIGSAGLGFFDSLRDSIQGNGVSDATDVTNVDPGGTTQPESDKQGGIDAAGSFVVSVFHHDVNAIIGATADLASSSSITLDADIVQRTRLGAIGESTRNALNEENENTKEFAVSAGYGFFHNDAHAVVEDRFVDDADVTQQAVLDAQGLIAVNAQVVYPFLGASDDGVNAAVTLEQFGLGSFQSLLDGTHGLAGLVNVYARTLADGGDDSLSLALGLMVTNTTNHVIARIGEGAHVQTSDALSVDNQSVSVNATLDTFSVGAGQMSAINLSVPGLAEAINRGHKREGGGVQDFIKDLIDPLGVSGKNAAGGTMLLTLGDHTTVAEIADAAIVGRDDWLNNAIDVTAISDLYDLALVQTGTASSQFGFSAAIAASNIKTDTRASVGDGVELSGGSLTINATDTLDRINILGAFLKGKQIGVGTSIGVNVIDQDVAAFLGRRDREAAAIGDGRVALSSVEVDASASGDVLSWVISGGIQGVGSSSAQPNAKRLGPVSLTVPVAINQIASESVAYIDAVTGSINDIAVDAKSDSNIDAVVIGASVAVQASSTGAGKLNLAGVGALAVNEAQLNSLAWISESTIDDSNDVRVEAQEMSQVNSDAGGASLVAGLAVKAAVSFGASVAINDVTSNVSAKLLGTKLDTGTTGQVDVKATANTSLTADSIAGAVAARFTPIAGGTFGGSGAGSRNWLDQDVMAEVGQSEENGSVIDTNSLYIVALHSGVVHASGFAFGVGGSGGAGASGAASIGIGLGLNEIIGATRATLNESVVKVSEQVQVEAINQTILSAITESSSVGAAVTGGFGAAIAGAGAGTHNLIQQQISATTIGSTVDAGDFMVSATDSTALSSRTYGMTVGAGISGGGTAALSIGISVAKNENRNQVDAAVLDGSTIRTSSPASGIFDGDVSVVATSDNTMEALALAASYVGGISSGLAVAVAGAGALAENGLYSATLARVSDSTINAGHNIHVNASRRATLSASIESDGVSVGGGNVGGGPAIGVSIATNTIGQTVQTSPDGDTLFVSEVKSLVEGSQMTAAGTLSVLTENIDTVTATVKANSVAGALGNVAGSAAVVGSSATNNLATKISAIINDESDAAAVASTVDAGSVIVRATNNPDDQNTETGVVTALVGSMTMVGVGGSGGAVAVTVSVSEASNRIDNTIDASVSRTTVSATTGDGLTLEANENVVADADAYAMAVALALSSFSVAGAGGGAKGKNQITSTTNSTLTDSDIDSPEADLDVTSTNTITADAHTHTWTAAAALIGLVGSGSVTENTITPTTTAEASGGAIHVRDATIFARATPVGKSDSAGFALSLGGLVGVSKSTVNISGEVTARLGNSDQEIFQSQTLAQTADFNGDTPSVAKADGSSGSLLGVEASVASITNTANVLAEIADGSTLEIASTNLFARRVSEHHADANSLAIGLGSFGSTYAGTNDSGNDIARVGSSVTLEGNSFRINAASIERTFAGATAGAGGVASGSSATAETRNTSTTSATIGAEADFDLTGSFQVLSNHLSHFDTGLSAIGGGVLTGSGGNLSNTIASTVKSEIGQQANMDAATIRATATNRIDKSSPFADDGFDRNANATVGGIVGGVGVGSATQLTLNTDVLIDDSALLFAGDSIDLHSANKINAIDELVVASGGVGAGSGVNTTLDALDNQAVVTVDPSAAVHSGGTMNITARGNAQADIQTSTEVYGVLTVGIGTSRVDIRPDNQVLIHGTLVADGDIQISAGTDSAPNRDNYDIDARLDVFSGSLIPITSSTATANLMQTNTIEVSENGVVRSGGDLRLHAQNDEVSEVNALAKSVSWTTAVVDLVEGVINAVGDLIGEGGQEVTEGSGNEAVTSTVQVTGLAETGLNRYRKLDITGITYNGGDVDSASSYSVQRSDDSDDSIQFTLVPSSLTSPLITEIRRLKNLINDHRSNELLVQQYQDEIDRMQAQLEVKGLAETPEGASEPQRIEQSIVTVVVDPITSSSGIIDIVAGQFKKFGDSGTGQVIAPSDPAIEIINQTRAFIETTGLFIPQFNGGVIINGMSNFSNSGTPSIVVENRAQSVDLENGDAPLVWPSITVSGPIANLGGSLTIRNPSAGAGDITINAPIEVLSQSVIAGAEGTLNIDLGQQGSTYEGSTEHARVVSYLDQIRTQSLTSDTYEDFIDQGRGDGKLSAGRIFLSAQYVNINSLIESGKSDYNLTLGDDVADAINAHTGDSVLRLNADTHLGGSEDFDVSYDPASGRIIIEELRAGGGYVEIDGHIANTSHGEIRVLGGYANININNETNVPIEIRRLDVSQQGSGTIILNDRAKGPGSPLSSPELSQTTLFQQVGDRVVETAGNIQTIHDDLSDIVYEPVTGLQYQFSIAEKSGTFITRTYTTSSWLGVIDEFAEDGANTVNTVESPNDTYLIDAGSYFVHDLSLPKYSHAVSTSSTTSGEIVVDQWTTWSGFLDLNKNYFTRTVEDSRETRIDTHSLEADRDIKINFVGYDEGGVNIESNGDIYFAGRVSNPTGRTNIRSNSPIEISNSHLGIVGGREIEVVANESSIGSENSPFLIDQSSTTLDGLLPKLDISAAGSANVRELSGDLVVRRFSGGSAMQLSVPGSIFDHALGSYVSGVDIRLVSDTGNIGSAESPLFIDPLTSINATAPGDIFVEAEFSDIGIDQIEAGGIVSLRGLNGRRIVDRRTEDDVDDFNAIESAAVWNSLQLTTEDGFDDKRTGRIETLENIKTGEYQTYWQLRNTQREPAEYDANHLIILSEAERSFYADNPDTIATLESSRTQQYHALHQAYGEFGNQFDPSFQYTATSDEIAAIDASMRRWTREELSNTLNFVVVTDTELVTEQPNIIASEIRLDATSNNQEFPGSIGSQGEPEFIELPVAGSSQTITLKQQAVLSTAGPNDVLYLGSAPIDLAGVTRGTQYPDSASSIDFVSLTLPLDATETWHDLGIQAGRSVYVDLSNDAEDPHQYDHFDEGIYTVRRVVDDGRTLIFENYAEGLETSQRLVGLGTLSPIVPDDLATHVRVARREDVDVQTTGPVTAIADTDILLGSAMDLVIGELHSLQSTFNGRPSDIRIKTDGNLSGDAAQTESAHVQGAAIVLESSGGSIGSLDQPLRIEVEHNNSIVARAQNEIVLQQNADETSAPNDLRIDQVFSAASFIDISSDSGITESVQSDRTNLKAAGDLHLRSDSYIGFAEAFGFLDFLDVEIGGTLTAVGPGGIAISENASDLRIRQVLSTIDEDGVAVGNRVRLRAAGSIVDAIDVVDPMDPYSANGAIVDGNPQTDIVGSGIELVAMGGTIGQATNELDVNQIGTEQDLSNPLTARPFLNPWLSVDSFLNTYVNETEGDLILNRVQTDQTAFLSAGSGSILPPRDQPSTVIAAKLWLFARDDIGLPTDPIDITTGAVEGIAITGSVYLAATGDLTVGGVVDPTSGAEGEQAGEFTPTRDLGSSGFQSGLGLSIKSTETLTIVEDLQSLGSLSIQGDIRLELPSGVSARSAGQLDIVSRHAEIRGSVDSLQTIVRGTAGDDTLVFKPESLDGPVRIEAGDGDDQIDVVEFPMTIDGGDGDNTIIGVSLIHEVVAAPYSAFATTHQRVSTKENFSQTPLSRFVSEFAKPPVVTINDDRFEFSDGVLRLKPDGFLQHPDDDELSVTVTFTDPDDTALSVDQVVTITTQANASVWTNADLVEDVNRSGHASALDALMVINFLNRVDDSLLPVYRAFDSMEPFYDVNRDGRVTALDALRVINYLSFGSRVLADSEPSRSDQNRMLRTGDTSEQPAAMYPSEGSNFVSQRGDLIDDELDRLAEDVALVRLF
ncbi:dockerin type I domain-containing protein [Rhodopirellula bahusiensis]|uniref:Hemolysin n=1 Tax=Rhodopirellula bahusiensis TaxID=2014065 RepID=A0A2G1W9R2_9BACT|nr:dockerin type I domain-containing protein [Rhodopirellula bahusiensis]PHQ35756.1 hemolysin [Rhodopirellula bahusiensis]